MRNKPGTHFGKKVKLDGYTFDSVKEAQFYERFIKDCGYRYEIHPNFTLHDKFTVGGINMRGLTYKPDFVVYEQSGDLKHVYDVKNSFGIYGVDAAANIRFRLFAARYNHPVEVVVVRKHDFKMKVLSTTKKFEQQIMTGVDYRIQEFIGE